MPHLSPVLWSKGTLLAPQHLQAQDRFLEEALAFQLGALVFCPWGFVRASVDREALAGGTLVVSAAAGRFPDGLLFDAPAGDAPPPPVALGGAWRPDQRTLLAYLAVPEYRPGGRNLAGADGGATARWRADETLRRDETTGLAERPVQVARANLRLVLEGESLEGYATLPVARLARSAAGEVTLDATFVPPLLDLAGSDVLQALARRLVERVGARGAVLAGARRQRNQGLADFSVTDVASFWLLYTVNTHLPGLRHLAEVRRGHPSALWEAMVALTGALSTFAPTPPPLPVYDHLRLGERFAALEARLLELLDTAVPESAVAVALRPVRPGVQAVAVEQERWLAAPQWFLAVSAPLRPAELVAKVVQGCKLGANDVVDALFRQALPGLELAHVAEPPAAVPVKLDFQYFAVRREGEAWDAVARGRTLAVHAPAELQQARFELVVVLR